MPAKSLLMPIRLWLYAAAAYNLVWGALHVFAPWLVPGVLRLSALDPLLWQALGLFVAVYAPAYAWAARRPERHAHLIAVAVLGKLAGLIGFAWAVSSGGLPLRFGLVVVSNDVVWLPAMLLYVRAAAARSGGWRAFATGA